MATELEPPVPGPTVLEAAASAPGLEDEEEHWLYGEENAGKREPDSVQGQADSSQSVQDISQGSRHSGSESTEVVQQAHQSGEDEDDEDSDSDDDDDVKVTIGNIKTGAPSYMGAPMNLNLKTGRSYGAIASAKLHAKGIDLDAPGNINGVPVLEVDLDSLEEKPWRKPGADLSDYFNYGFNEETWKAYCEKERRIQLGLEPISPTGSENKITVQQGRTGIVEKELENDVKKTDLDTEFTSPSAVWAKAGPPPNSWVDCLSGRPSELQKVPQKLGGTIDVISGYAGNIRRFDGRRREMRQTEENPIQVLGDHVNKPPPPLPQPPQQFAPPAGPPLPPITTPPPHFLRPPPPVTSIPPPMHPPGMPPPGPPPGLFPPPMAPPPALLIPTLNGGQTKPFVPRQPPRFGYSGGGNAGFISYPPISSSHTPWVTTMDKSTNSPSSSHWEYSGSKRERDRTPATSDYSYIPTSFPPSDDDRYQRYSRERSYDYDREYRRSREREDRHREHRHKDKEESGKHKSSRRKQHENEEGESHRRHKHKKNKRSKEGKEDGASERDERDMKK